MAKDCQGQPATAAAATEAEGAAAATSTTTTEAADTRGYLAFVLWLYCDFGYTR